jgi:transcriptional activator of cad operon
MDLEVAKTLQIGAWCADPLRSTLTRGNEIVRVEARSMRLLLSLAARAGQTMSVEKLLDEVWEGVVVSPDSVYQAVASLRRLLGDDPKNPTYIATAPRLGYRMVAEVSVVPSAAPEPAPPFIVLPPGASPSAPRIPRQMPSKGVLRLLISLVSLVALVGLGVVIHEHGSGRAAQPQSVAVLPFIDLTSQAMDEEYFADGITEELRDQLSHVAGLRVPAATSSLSVKGKKLSATDVGRALGVAYVLDGSVRESDSTMRITARLVRVDDGYVVWSQSYDRRTPDKLKIQEDIAREVTASLAASIRR